MDDPLVSIIVLSRNSSSTIGKCLDALKKQTYRRIEIIVVDNNSADGTREIAAKYGVRVSVAGPERCAQINHGISEAKGEFIYFTGADLVPDSDYVEKAVKKSLRNNLDAIYTSVVTAPDIRYWAKVKAVERVCYIGEPMHEAARFMRKNVFQSIGGIDENLFAAGEELDLQNRLDIAGFKTGKIDGVETHLDEATTLEEIFRKYCYYGKHIMKYVRKNPSYRLKQMLPIRKAYLTHSAILLRNPKIFVGFVLYKVVQYGATLCGIALASMSDEGFRSIASEKD
jgi:glycosyltransferase involved in cell wall biosynthesis